MEEDHIPMDLSGSGSPDYKKIGPKYYSSIIFDSIVLFKIVLTWLNLKNNCSSKIYQLRIMAKTHKFPRRIQKGSKIHKGEWLTKHSIKMS